MESRVVIRKHRLFGYLEVVDGPTDVPVESLYGTWTAERDMERVAYGYDVPVEAVEDAVRWCHCYRTRPCGWPDASTYGNGFDKLQSAAL